MSYLGGPECSTAGNPLTQFTKHIQDDKSLQRDRLVGRGPGGQFESMRTQRPMNQGDKMIESFLQQPGLPQQSSSQPFAMEQMRRELDKYSASGSRTGSPGWAAEYDPGEKARMEAAFKSPRNGSLPSQGLHPAEFQMFQQINGSASRVSPVSQSNGSVMNGYQRPMGMRYGSGTGMSMGMGMMNSYRPMSAQQAAEATVESKGKGRMVELDDKDWEKQFAQIDAAGQEDVDTEARARMEEELDEIDRSVLSETNADGDFESIWRGIRAERAANRQHLGVEAGYDDYDEAAHEHLHTGDFDPWNGFDSFSNGNFRDPQLGDYIFEDENPFQTVADPFDEGVRIMHEGGNLSLAALAFEAAVQQRPQHTAAWTMLGSAQAQNEKEAPAIRALEQALKLEPDNLEALMGLAVSYTNEGYDATAYRTLERWLATKYPQILSPDDLSSPADVGFTDRAQLHARVADAFLRAAQLCPQGEYMDPDVQVGLGVLFYGDEAYDKAVDCFAAALASCEAGVSNRRQQVHLLWNRLGATLANSGRSEEAIAAYERALALRPGFVRARYNLGVSCINVGCYEQAAGHLLGALAMHAVVAREGWERVERTFGSEVKADTAGLTERELDRLMGANSSANLYETLRRVFGQMDRGDLAEKVVPGMDVEEFRGEFEF